MIGEITTRDALKPGDCFEYIDYPGKPHLAGKKIVVAFENVPPPSFPREWGWSHAGALKVRGSWRVRRIKHWDDKDSQPTVLPCIEPMNDFYRLKHQRVGGLTGLECLERYEEAMRAEEVRRIAPDTYVTDDLSAAQITLARKVWSAKLRDLVERDKATAAEHERARVTCDPVDEMPNLADA